MSDQVEGRETKNFSDDSDELLFAEDSPAQEDALPAPAERTEKPWLMLIVDDDDGVHAVTKFGLKGFTFRGRPIQMLHAYSAKEAEEILAQSGQVAVALVDVVMESNQAGLELVNHIRHTRADSKMRIVLRTGQPGYAPERDVMMKYEINDYRSKAELTHDRLITTVASALRNFSDLHDLQRSRQERAAAKAQSEAKSLFLASMSHEIRTPMNGVIGMLDLLRVTELTPDQLELVDTCSDSASMLLTIINDILDFSKMEAGKLKLAPTPTAIEEIVASVVDVIAPRAWQKDLEIIMEIAPDVPDVVSADPVRLKQILINLAGNAVKFTRHGHVIVRVENVAMTPDRSEASIRFLVEDTGIGITPEQQKRLFNAFEQAEDTTASQFGGTGLGLAISRRLVELMGGRIGVNSNLGNGATFWFDIQIPVDLLAPESRQELKDRRFAIVGDVNELSRVSAKTLEQHGAHAAAFKSADDFFEFATTETRGKIFDGVVMNEVVDGMHCLRAIRGMQDYPGLAETPVLVMVRRNSISLIERCRNEGVSHFTYKPLRPNLLMRGVADMLNPRQPSKSLSGPAAYDRPYRIGAAYETKVRLDNATVLIVEDSRTNRVVISKLLKQRGCMPVLCENGREALTRLERGERYDLILSDCFMPEMDGFEFTRRVRDMEAIEGTFTPIIALSAGVMKEEIDRCLAVGMNEFLSKPINQADLDRILIEYVKTDPQTPTRKTPVLRSDDEVIDDGRKVGVDLSVMLEVFDGLTAEFRDMVFGYLDDQPVLIAQLEEAIMLRLWDEASRSAHRLSGGASAMGALEFGAHCSNIELHIAKQNYETATILAQEVSKKFKVVHNFLMSVRWTHAEG